MNKDRCTAASFSITKGNKIHIRSSSALTTLSDFLYISFNRHNCTLLVCTKNILYYIFLNRCSFWKTLYYSDLWVPSSLLYIHVWKLCIQPTWKWISWTPTQHGCIVVWDVHGPGLEYFCSGNQHGIYRSHWDDSWATLVLALLYSLKLFPCLLETKHSWSV